jgi:hypothetical protein
VLLTVTLPPPSLFSPLFLPFCLIHFLSEYLMCLLRRCAQLHACAHEVLVTHLATTRMHTTHTAFSNSSHSHAHSYSAHAHAQAHSLHTLSLNSSILLYTPLHSSPPTNSYTLCSTLRISHVFVVLKKILYLYL